MFIRFLIVLIFSCNYLLASNYYETDSQFSDFSFGKGFVPKEDMRIEYDCIQSIRGTNGEVFEFFELEDLPLPIGDRKIHQTADSYCVLIDVDEKFASTINDLTWKYISSQAIPSHPSQKEEKQDENDNLDEKSKGKEKDKNDDESLAKKRKVETLNNPTKEKDEALLYPPLDRRTNVNNPTKAPWSMNGRLEMKFESKDSNKKSIVALGSAFMVSPSCALTAAHNLHLSDELKVKYPHLDPDAVQVTFFPALEGNKINMLTSAVSYMVSPEWVTSNDVNNDLALLRFKDPIGRKSGFFAVANISHLQILEEGDVHVTGYPGELKNYMYTMKGPVMATERDKFYYNVDTTTGNSGSCVAKKKDSPLCVGIHTTGPYGPNKWNGAVGITTAKYNRIGKWFKDLGEVK